MPLGTEVGLGPGNIVLDGDPALLKGAQQPSPSFRPMSIVTKRSPILLVAEHLLKMAGAAILEFQNLEILRVGRVKMPNFAVIGQAIAEIWRFFKMAAAAILYFQNVEILGVGRVKRVSSCQFPCHQSNHCWDMAISNFSKMATVRHV